MTDDSAATPSAPRDPSENAQLALLLEVAGTPKPGNVDRRRDYENLRFEHFLAGAIGAGRGLHLAADGAPVGEAFEHAVAGMAGQSGGNTQFGALLALIPLVRAAATTDVTPEAVSDVIESTTVDDACDFYRAFDHVEVAVKEPPAEIAELDVRRGSAATVAVRAQGLTLADVMALSASVDGVAAEWVSGFERSFEAAEWILEDTGPIYRRSADAFVRLLADEVDTFVVTRNGESVAEEATDRARAVLGGEEDAEALADEFVARDINPGTTADLTAAALFVSLEHGLEV